MPTPLHQIVSDGSTVWVNGSQGECLGRFSIWGVDIHKSIADQITSGSQCLECTHGTADHAAWTAFKIGMLKHHEIAVTDQHRPNWLAGRT